MGIKERGEYIEIERNEELKVKERNEGGEENFCQIGVGSTIQED